MQKRFIPLIQTFVDESLLSSHFSIAETSTMGIIQTEELGVWRRKAQSKRERRH